MSRSCQRALFSKPTAAYPRKRRAIPQRRSERIGFRLCGIAEEPFWPRPKGSASSRTSVRWAPRISSAIFSTVEPRMPGWQDLGVAVALHDLGRGGGRLYAAPRRSSLRPWDLRSRRCRRRRRSCLRPRLLSRAPDDPGYVPSRRPTPRACAPTPSAPRELRASVRP